MLEDALSSPPAALCIDGVKQLKIRFPGCISNHI